MLTYLISTVQINLPCLLLASSQISNGRLRQFFMIILIMLIEIICICIFHY